VPKSDRPIFRRRFDPSWQGTALYENRFGNRSRKTIAGLLPRPRVSSLSSPALALAAAFTWASLACLGQAGPAAALPDSPQPQGKASSAPAPTPCLVKRASVAIALAAAETAAQSAPSHAGMDAAVAAIGKPQPKPPDAMDAILVPCTAVERILSNLQQVRRFPAVDWYARFLDGPQVTRMSPKQKAWLAFRDVGDPFNTVTILGSSAIDVASNPHSAYGPGMAGFRRYVGVSYAQDMTGEFIGTFLIPSIAHQDPHYHRMTQATLKRRIAHCLYQVVWTQGDDGKGMVNYADLAGFAIDDEIANLYVPGRDTDLPASAERYATGLALAPVDNFITEFLPDVARKIHVRVVLIQRIINQVANKDAVVSQP
jgi:hypothetical protein